MDREIQRPEGSSANMESSSGSGGQLRRREPDSVHAVGKFIGFALLFNLLLWLFALFAQIRGWVDVTASYVILFAMWIVGTLICLALGAQLRLQRKRLAVVVGSVIWAGALMGLNAVAPKPIKSPVTIQPNVPAGSQSETTAKTESPSNTSQPPVGKIHQPPIERTAKFVVMVPFDTAPNAFPIPMDDNPDDPLFNTYTEFHSLAMNGTMPEATRETEGSGQVTWSSRPISTEEAPEFLSRLLQYYVFRNIDNLQRNSMTVYVGYPAEANAGIEPPDAEVYPYKKLSTELADNIFFRPFLHRPSSDDMTWKIKPCKFPKGTEIKFITQKPGKYLVRFQRPAHFNADFIVQHFLGTGVGQVPKHFASKNTSTIMQWAFTVTMHYRIEHPDDNEFNPGNYAQWLDALCDGLRKKLEIDQNEKRSR
jgi:hypothetical protein